MLTAMPALASTVLYVRVPAVTADKVREVADTYRSSQAAVVARALEFYFAENFEDWPARTSKGLP
jgi:hypothetical protein